MVSYSASTNMELFQIFSDDYDKCEELSKIKRDRNYTYEDAITCSREKLDNYEETVSN